jgi:hypothetical protein
MPNKSVQDRFWEKVDIKGKDECWHWKGALKTTGYGKFWYNGRCVNAHRIAYILTYGEIEDGLIIRHTCDTRPCCNPFHLEKGTQIDNINDMVIRGRSSKANGMMIATHKLYDHDIIEIREKRRLGCSLKSLSIEYDVSPVTINNIERRKTWKHI